MSKGISSFGVKSPSTNVLLREKQGKGTGKQNLKALKIRDFGEIFAPAIDESKFAKKFRVPSCVLFWHFV